MNNCFSFQALRLSVLLVLCAAGWPAQAHDYYAKFLHIHHPWAEPTELGAADSAVYVKFDEIAADDQLISASTSLADRVELRGPAGVSPSGTEGLLLNGIGLASGSELELWPGSARLVLKDLKLPLQLGRSYPMTLEFEKSGVVFVMVSVGTP